MIKGSTSNPKDAFYGEGVYLTTLDHIKNNRNQILINNYNRAGRDGQPGHSGRADCYIKFAITELKAKKQKDENDRDVWLYLGAIYLENYNYCFSIDRIAETWVSKSGHQHQHHAASSVSLQNSYWGGLEDEYPPAEPIARSSNWTTANSSQDRSIVDRSIAGSSVAEYGAGRFPTSSTSMEFIDNRSVTTRRPMVSSMPTTRWDDYEDDQRVTSHGNQSQEQESGGIGVGGAVAIGAAVAFGAAALFGLLRNSSNSNRK